MYVFIITDKHNNPAEDIAYKTFEHAQEECDKFNKEGLFGLIFKVVRISEFKLTSNCVIIDKGVVSAKPIKFKIPDNIIKGKTKTFLIDYSWGEPIIKEQN